MSRRGVTTAHNGTSQTPAAEKLHIAHVVHHFVFRQLMTDHNHLAVRRRQVQRHALDALTGHSHKRVVNTRSLL